MWCLSTRTESFHFDDNFHRIALWVLALKGCTHRAMNLWGNIVINLYWCINSAIGGAMGLLWPAIWLGLLPLYCSAGQSQSPPEHHADRTERIFFYSHRTVGTLSLCVLELILMITNNWDHFWWLSTNIYMSDISIAMGMFFLSKIVALHSGYNYFRWIPMISRPFTLIIRLKVHFWWENHRSVHHIYPIAGDEGIEWYLTRIELFYFDDNWWVSAFNHNGSDSPIKWVFQAMSWGSLPQFQFYMLFVNIYEAFIALGEA